MPTLLFVTCHLPYPLISGGRRREYELLTRLAAHHDFHLLAFSKTYGEDIENSIVFEEFCRSVTVVPVHCRDGQDPYQVRRHTSEEGLTTIRNLVDRNSIDLIHVEGFYLMQHVPCDIGVPIFLQEQNIEYLLWKQRAKSAQDPRERSEAVWEYLRTLESETSSWQRADMCGAVTTDDLEVMRSALPSNGVRLVPDGFDHLGRIDGDESRRVRRSNADEHRVVFVGNFAYQPNVDAALYLSEKIWPIVSRYIPRARLALVGNAPPPEVEALRERSPNVDVTGRVPAVSPYLDEADVVVCPLRVGGGIKVKVLEALCRGKALVTTSVGVQGIPRPNEAMRVVDDPVDFAKATVELLVRPTLRRRLEQNARRAAALLPTWDEAARALEGCYDDLLRPEREAAAIRSDLIPYRA